MSTAEAIALPAVESQDEEVQLKEIIEHLSVQQALETTTQQEDEILAQARQSLADLFERERNEHVDAVGSDWDLHKQAIFRPSTARVFFAII